MLRSILTVAQLPAKATLQALRSATSPNSINALSSAIAQAAINTSDQEEGIEIEGLSIEIEFNEERLLSTAGISTVISLGTLYWIGERLKVQIRYSKLIIALEDLKRFLRSGNTSKAEDTLRLIDTLSNPLIDPETFLPIDEPDQVASIYRTLFDKPAEAGSMFNASNFTSSIDDGLKVGSRSAILAASSQTDEVLETIIKKARPIAGKVASRIVGAALWVDTVWWVATSALDLGLNYLGIDEEDQKIPILSDIPVVGALFDLSDSVGSSFVDLIISPILDGIIGLFSVEDEVQILTDALFGIITSAALNPTITPFIIAVLDFYIEDVKIDFSIPASFEISTIEGEFSFDYFGLRPDPLDVLILWLYAIVGKIVFKAWVRPAFLMLKNE